MQGIGGAGKTQLVLDYIQRYRQDYSGVFWIEANEPESVERDYIQIYTLLYNIHQEVGGSKIQLQQAVAAAKRWFRDCSQRWMFVFDNADSIRDRNDPPYIDLRRFLPDGSNIHVILTTRDQLAANLSELPMVEVDEMKPEEAVHLFQKQVRLSESTSQQETQVGQIVQTLGNLALAVTLSASYVAATPRLRINLSGFLPEYQERRKELLAQQPTWLIHQYGQSVLTTWETTFAAVEAQDAKACQFLGFLAFFNQDDIPSTFPEVAELPDLASWKLALLQERIRDYDIEGFFRTLTGFSFVKYQADQNSYSMHSLVQAWAYDRLTTEQQRRYCYAAGLAIYNMTEIARTSTPAVKGRLVPHVMNICYKILKIFKYAPNEQQFVHRLLSDLEQFLTYCGHVEEVVALRRSHLQICQSWYGEDDHSTLETMDNLASDLLRVGQPHEALSLSRAVLEKRKRTLQTNHIDTMYSKSNIAAALSSLGRIQEALPMKREIVETLRQTVGDDDKETRCFAMSLAETLNELGDSQKAISMQRVLVQKARLIEGRSDPDTLRCARGLAISLHEVGELEEALTTIRDVVEESRKSLGANHQQTLYSMHVHGRLLCKSGCLDEALSLQRDTLERTEKYQGWNQEFKTIQEAGLELTEREIATREENSHAFMYKTTMAEVKASAV